MSLMSILKFFIPSKTALEFYDACLMNEIQYKSHSALCGEGPSRLPALNEFVVDIHCAYNNQKIFYYYLITDFPHQLPVTWLSTLRSCCSGGTSLSCLTHFIPEKIDWGSHKMRTKMKILDGINKEFQDELQGVSKFQASNYSEKIQQQVFLEQSVEYLTDATKERDRGFAKTTTLLILSGYKGEDFDKSASLVESYLGADHFGFSYQRVMHNIPDILSAFSPFSYKINNPDISKVLPKHTFSDEIFSRMNTYTQGVVGIKGVYIGSDLYSQFPVFVMFKKRITDSANVLMTAETGGGKSNLVKVILAQLLAYGYYGTILDVEGREYLPLYEFISKKSSAIIVNMGAGSGKYFDPVEIPEPTNQEDIDSVSLNMSKSYTELLFRLLAGKLLEEDAFYTTFIEDAVSQTYKNAGVSLVDSSTWSNSKGLTVFDIYRTILKLDSYYRAKDEKNFATVEPLLFKLKTTLSSYFEEDGANASMFRDRIVLSDLADKQLVLCSFGMAGKSEQTVHPVQMALMQLSASMFSYHRSLTAYLNGQFNFKVWEEFQRWGKFEGSDKTISVALTGGRKLGDINFIITNAINEILKDDRFGILANLQFTFIGKIKEADTRSELLHKRNLSDFEEELTNLSVIPEDVESISEFTKQYERCKAQGDLSPMLTDSAGKANGTGFNDYKYSFLFSDNSNTTLVKLRLPKNLNDSTLFKTAPVQSKEVKQAESGSVLDTEQPIVEIPEVVIEEANVDLGFNIVEYADTSLEFESNTEDGTVDDSLSSDISNNSADSAGSELYSSVSNAGDTGLSFEDYNNLQSDDTTLTNSEQTPIETSTDISFDFEDF